MKFHIINEENEVVISSIEDKCKSCIENCNSNFNTIICPLYKEDRRFGVEKLKDKSIFLCTTKRASKTANLFKEKIKILAYSIPSIEEIKKDILIEATNAEKNKYSQIVHNLRTLNAQSIQSQYKFIPQSLFSDNYTVLYEFVKNEIVERIDDATIAFLRLAKNNAHMKTEFTTHEKLSVESPNLSIQFHKLKSVILNVYHSFNIDFVEKNIRLKINESENENYLEFDYDTIRVAFYHLFLNTIKYIQPNTNLNIEIYQKDKYIYLDFCMNSLHIDESEKEQIFEDTYSGKSAIKLKLNGSGLGMGLIKKALLLNEANIEVICSNKKNKFKGESYSDNIFRIKFNAV